ncbi:hypothetical protein GCM10009775_10210 [Microbacterium aoyamense]|uniref:ABC transporter domain-containing protein n=1 Tax=Microbacterium aoyamense TaxID=344166 RepID=A0ABN2PEB9_9MICO|nr:ABC transporter ATP-binding protein [Microbacterium aoyamense]
MLDTAITARDLSKTYRIQVAGHTNRITTAIINRIRHPLTSVHYENFEALRDVSFDIPWGEAVGIIGRNGAGKSTLLKLLTQVTTPTKGMIDIGGRVGSLLEVGTGFHPELTGRENIYLNGALLGMGRKEIKARFDEIVAFSEVEQFLEVPVKRYSSGMYVRLAFAVAAHLDSEILAIDEVLAVGDAEFQRKAIMKMQQVARDGRTVLYVSHLMNTVTSLCTSAIYLENGTVGYQGSVDGALERYRDSFADLRNKQLEPHERWGTGELRFKSVEMAQHSVHSAEDIVIDYRVHSSRSVIGKYFLRARIKDMNGAEIVRCDSRLTGHWFDPTLRQEGKVRIRNLWLKPGRYTVDMWICQAGVFDGWDYAESFEVLPSLPYPEMAMDDAIDTAVVLADFDYEEA